MSAQTGDNDDDDDLDRGLRSRDGDGDDDDGAGVQGANGGACGAIAWRASRRARDDDDAGDARG